MSVCVCGRGGTCVCMGRVSVCEGVGVHVFVWAGVSVSGGCCLVQ